MKYCVEPNIFLFLFWFSFTTSGVFSNQGPNWDITFLLNRNFGLTSINSDLEFPIEISNPKNDLLYSVPANSLFPNGKFPKESLYIQLNFQPIALNDEYYFIAIRDPDMVLRFSLSLTKKDMYRVSLKYHPVDSVAGEKEIQFPIPSENGAWRLGVLIEKNQIKFFISCPQTQPVAFHIEDNVNLLDLNLFKPGASAFLLNSGLKMSPAYFNGILTEFGFHPGKNLDRIHCQSTEMLEGSGEPIDTFDPEFGNILVTQVDHESSTTIPSDVTMSSPELITSEDNSSTKLSTDGAIKLVPSRDPIEFAPYIDLSNFVLRLYDLKENRILTESKVENGVAHFTNGTTISLLEVPAFQTNSDNAEVLLSIDVSTEKTTSLVDIASGQTIAVHNISEGIPIEIMQKYRNKVMFEILLETGALQVDTHSGRWILQDTTTGGVNEIKNVRDGFFILDDDKSVAIPRQLQSNDHFLAIEASTGKMETFFSSNGEPVEKAGKSITESPDLHISSSPITFSTITTKEVFKYNESIPSVSFPYSDTETTKTFQKECESCSSFDSENSGNSLGGLTTESGDESSEYIDETSNILSIYDNKTTDNYSSLISTDRESDIPVYSTTESNAPHPLNSEDYQNSYSDAPTGKIEEIDHRATAESSKVDTSSEDYETTNYEDSTASMPTIQTVSSFYPASREYITTIEPVYIYENKSSSSMEDSHTTEKSSENSAMNFMDVTPNNDHSNLNYVNYTTKLSSMLDKDISPLVNQTIIASTSQNNSFSTTAFHSADQFTGYSQVYVSTSEEILTGATKPLSTTQVTESIILNHTDHTQSHSTQSFEEKNINRSVTPTATGKNDEIITTATFLDEKSDISSDGGYGSNAGERSTTRESGRFSQPQPDIKDIASAYTKNNYGKDSTNVMYNSTITSQVTETLMFSEIETKSETTIDPMYLFENQSSKDILKPDCYCLEEFLNSEKIDQFRGPAGSKGDQGEPGLRGRDGKCPSSCESVLTPELINKLKEASGASCKLDVEDPKIVELLKITLAEYFKNSEVLNKLQEDILKDRSCGCSNDKKDDSLKKDSIAADILDSLRKISYGAIVMEKESSLARVAYSMPIGVMVYLKEEDKFYLKTQEKDNIWRIIQLGPNSEAKMIPRPEMSKTSPSPQNSYPDNLNKKLYLVAQSETFNGELKYRAKLEGGHSGALFICQREASSTNLSQPFYPLLNTDMFNLEYVVPPMHRFNLPLINLRGEKIFDDFNSLIRGKQRPQAPILSFDGKDINEDTLSPCIWLGEKPMYQSGEYEQVARFKCRNWQTSYPSEKATAARIPVLANATGLLHQSNLFEESCSKRCRVLCIQIIPS